MSLGLWQPPRKKLRPTLWQPEVPLSGRLRAFSSSPPPQEVRPVPVKGEIEVIKIESLSPSPPLEDIPSFVDGTTDSPHSPGGRHETAASSVDRTTNSPSPLPSDGDAPPLEDGDNITSTSPQTSPSPSPPPREDTNSTVDQTTSNASPNGTSTPNAIHRDSNPTTQPTELPANATQTETPPYVYPDAAKRKKAGRPKGRKDGPSVKRPPLYSPFKGTSRYENLTRPPSVIPAAWDIMSQHCKIAAFRAFRMNCTRAGIEARRPCSYCYNRGFTCRFFNAHKPGTSACGNCVGKQATCRFGIRAEDVDYEEGKEVDMTMEVDDMG